ncbi:MAG: HNH endonuclease, partial [bacterium]|nr:HNH endonuclease [bacterium]
ICQYDVRLGNTLIGIEAAHIKWVAANGPDEIQNGIALCTIHHKAFDRGAISLSPDYKLLVSENVIGEYWADKLFRNYSGNQIKLPISENYYPEGKHISWHMKEVFRAPALK